MPVVGAGPLERFTESVCVAMGASRAAAGEVARHLVGANLRGHDSHGVMRLSRYLAESDRDKLRPGAEPRILSDGGATCLVDAGRCFGQVSTMFALEWCLERTPRHGLAAAAVRHSAHIGRVGEYTERAAQAGLVGIVTVGAAGPDTGTVAPHGGTGRFLGTNPWSVGVPAEPRPFLFDAATSAIAEGKARVALVAGKPVPEGVLWDAAGRPSQDPADLYAGGSLRAVGGEIAGHKGSGLGLASALIGGMAMIGDAAPTMAGTMFEPEGGSGRLAGVFLIVIDPGAFGDRDEYRRQVSAVLEAARQAPAAGGDGSVAVAGDPEAASMARRRRDGIPVVEGTWNDLGSIAARFGVALPDPL